MGKFRFKLFGPVLNILLAVFVGGSVYYGFVAYAEEKPLSKSDPPPEKIHITADRLEVDNEARQAEFIGRVVAIQGNTKIESDRLKIYYKQDVKKDKEAPTTQDQIEKIIARGNVKIVLDDRIAYTDQAVYIAATGVFVLTGPQTKVVSGKNFISGEKITVYRNDSRMSVVGNPNQRVEAVFYSQEKDSEKKVVE